MGRQENIAVFEDTQNRYSSDTDLISSIQYSTKYQQFFSGIGSLPNLSAAAHPSNIIVSRKRTLEAAKAYKGKNVCILNFASATNPGGGVVKGSSAQEEAICRCSTLYPCLNKQKNWNLFYNPHRNTEDPLHNDDCIYTPKVTVFKSDDDSPKILPASEWYNVNVITCAAPNLRKNPSNTMNSGDGVLSAKISNSDLQKLHEKRLTRILDIAASQGNEVVILGAFGCGAFRNPPEVVSAAAKSVLSKYAAKFETIEFAVYCPPQDDTNYQIFKRALSNF